VVCYDHNDTTGLNFLLKYGKLVNINKYKQEVVESMRNERVFIKET